MGLALHLAMNTFTYSFKIDFITCPCYTSLLLEILNIDEERKKKNTSMLLSSRAMSIVSVLLFIFLVVHSLVKLTKLYLQDFLQLPVFTIYFHSDFTTKIQVFGCTIYLNSCSLSGRKYFFLIPFRTSLIS